MRLVRRCVTPGRLGLVVGTLAITGCVAIPSGDEYSHGNHYLYGYRQYAAPPPGYYWWYPRQYGPSGYYRPAGYPPPIVVVRDDRNDHHHDHAKGPDDGRGDQGERHRDRDRDRDRDHDRHRDTTTVDPTPGHGPRSGESQTAPQVVDEDGEQPAPGRRRRGARPQSPLPAE